MEEMGTGDSLERELTASASGKRSRGKKRARRVGGPGV